MSATENTALVQKLVGAFQTGDLATVASCFSPDAVWDFPGRSVLSGTFKGPEEIVAFLARSYELSGATLAVDLIDMRALEPLHHEISGGAIVRTWHRSDEGAIAAFFGED